MAARFLDMALDDVAKSRAVNNRSPNPRGGGVRRGAGPTGRDSPSRPNRSSPYSRNTPEDRWTHDKFDESNQRSSSGGRGGDRNNGNRAQGGEANAKIIVENLHYAVTLEDIKELFDTHAGPVKFAEVKYDPSGRSTGVATILFKTPADAATAIKKLHGIALDGQPMKITFAPLPPNRTQDRRSGGPSKEAPKRDVFSRLGSSEADIASRLGKLNPVPSTTGGGGGGSGGRGGQGSSSQARKQGGGGSGGGGASGGSGGGTGSSRGAPRDKKKPQVKTAEELDAEMDTYMGDATV
ncbi:hypothetical protein EDD21DRAFT_367735 [Dissophora ornata]|nr:hypothetical protein BGZ58_006303 [Dissophora ornata]KAI8603912.1 hypothetical protein EDD21DRAFT_367735 [Dissophora ornata]